MRLFSFLVFFVTLLSCCSCFRSYAPPAGEVHGTANFYIDNPPEEGVHDLEIPVWIDKDFNPSERASIKAALADWNLVLNGYEHFKILDDALQMPAIEVAYRIINSGQGLMFIQRNVNELEVQLEDSHILAWTNGLGGNLIHVVTARIGSRDLRIIISHEVGHALGIDHIRIPGTLMYPGYSQGGTCIDKVTAQALAAVDPRLDWHHLDYCPAP